MHEPPATRPMRLLLLWGDLYGANCTFHRTKPSILDAFRGFGWDLTSAGVRRTVRPCAFAAQRGSEPIELDATLDDVGPLTDYDGISVMPGPAHRGLIASAGLLIAIRDAAEAGVVVSAWCRGVRVLAAAEVLRGKRVVGHSDDREAIEAAGAIYVGHDHPPVVDGRLVTGARSHHYRIENVEAIRRAMDGRLGDSAG